MLLILLGIAAQLAAVWALTSVDPLREYAMPAPDVRRVESSDAQAARADTGFDALIEARDDVAEQLGDVVSALSMSAIKNGGSVSRDGESATAALWGVDLRWQETCPRRMADGRWMDSAELAHGARVAVLDEDLAFELFGSESAEGAEVSIEGTVYTVIGVARHSRGVGEADEYSAYIPLRSASKQGIQMDVAMLHAVSAVSSGLDQSFAEAANAAWGAGELHNLRKERMGALLLSRLLFCAFGLALAFRLSRRWAKCARRWREQVAELRRHAYLRRWLGPALLRILGVLLGAALLLAMVWALLSVGIEPVYSFTEWVPESLVSASALRTVFWNRVSHAARLISVATPESARIAFWGTLDRAGAVMLLLGLALGRNKRGKIRRFGNQNEEAGV